MVPPLATSKYPSLVFVAPVNEPFSISSQATFFFFYIDILFSPSHFFFTINMQILHFGGRRDYCARDGQWSWWS
jgi:hypothetical protein